MYNLCSSSTGVRNVYLYEQESLAEDRYIQHISRWGKDDAHMLIICLYPAQARKLKEMHHLQIDLHYKPVQGTTMIWAITGQVGQRMLYIC